MRPRILQKPPADCYTLAELSEFTNIPRSTLLTWRDRKLFKVRRYAGRKIAINVEEWNAFARKNGQPLVHERRAS